MSWLLSREECERLCFDGDMTLEDAYERVVPSLLTLVAMMEKKAAEREKLISLLRQWKDEHSAGADQEHERADRAEALVAELEKERDELSRVFDANVRLAAEKWAAIERADRAEAGLLAAQEALKDAADTFEEFEVALQMLGHPTSAQAAGIAKNSIRDVLARGGGQQETG